MDNFRDKFEAHEHSLRVLELISLYDAFMDSLTVIADMGCGSGLDINWWATATSRDDPPVPYNYTCYAVDKDFSHLTDDLPGNVIKIQGNFEEKILPRTVDVMWSHDSFQYALNPLQTLKNWNEQMTVNGMLVLVVPQTSNYQYNRHVNRVYDGCFFQYNVCNLMYMLAVNGFDCKDSYMYKAPNDPWIHLAVYKTDVPPMDPATTRWYDLIEQDLLHDSLAASINKHGHLRQEDIILPWLDKDWYFVKD
jgi:trans-aconitate methyltransferase